MAYRVPLVLQVDTVIPGCQSRVVDNCDRLIARLKARPARKDQRVIVDLGTLAAEIVARADSMRFDAGVRKVTLASARPIAAKGPRRYAVINQIALLIRMKRKGRITGEGGDLVIDIFSEEALQCDDPKIIL